MTLILHRTEHMMHVLKMKLQGAVKSAIETCCESDPNQVIY